MKAKAKDARPKRLRRPTGGGKHAKPVDFTKVKMTPRERRAELDMQRDPARLRQIVIGRGTHPDDLIPLDHLITGATKELLQHALAAEQTFERASARLARASDALFSSLQRAQGAFERSTKLRPSSAPRKSPTKKGLLARMRRYLGRR